MASLYKNQGSRASEGGGNGRRPGGEAHDKQGRIVRYGAMSWVGEFTHKGTAVLTWGKKVVVQSDRGIELGEHIGPPSNTCPAERFSELLQCYVRNSGPEFCRPNAGRILRLASENDLNEQKHLNSHVNEDIRHCAAFAARLGLDLKVVTAEHLLGGERIVFYFRSAARVDFRQLVKELAQHYRTRIEMRQVGARDEARLVADHEICGRECCCKNFLKKLRPVNMKMAKLQKSTLDPSKVSGRCGRLRCCLRFEHAGYEEFAQRLPRIGSRIQTEYGPATVLERQVLTQLVAVRTDDNRLFSIPVEEIQAFDLPPEPPEEKPESPPTKTEVAKPARPPRGSRSRRSRSERTAQSQASSAPRKEPPPAEEKVEENKEVPRSKSRFRPESPAPVETEGDTKPAKSEPADQPTAPSPDVAAGKRGSPTKRRRRRRRKPGRGGSSPPPSTAGSAD
ncbi:MAG: hypothetical protein KAY37_00625 [Phycisphaerae bacterium]|nr:hypothetical protein [Phycisphaerae bacterium]